MKKISKKNLLRIPKYSFIFLFLLFCLVSVSQINPQWSQKIESTNDEGSVYLTWTEYLHGGSSFGMDSQNNIIVGGTNNGAVPIDIDGSDSSYFLYGNNSHDVFAASYNEEGEVRWGFSVGSAWQDELQCLTVDPNGDTWMAGRFQDTIDVDPGEGEYTFVPADGDRDIYIARYDTSGSFVAAGQIVTEYVNPTCGYIYSMEVDNQHNLYISGTYKGLMDIDPGPDTVYLPDNTSGTKSFVVKYNNSMQLLDYWSLSTEYSGGAYILDMLLTKDNGFYLCGHFSGTVDFDLGPNTYNVSAPIRNAFLARYDPSGNLLWFRHPETQLESKNRMIAVDDYDGVIVGGNFREDIVFPLINGDTLEFDYNGGEDLYLVQYDSTGNIHWANYVDGTTYLKSIEISDDASFYIAFRFSGTVNLDMGNTNFELITQNNDVDLGTARYHHVEGSFMGAFAFINPGSHTQTLACQNGYLYLVGTFESILDLDTSYQNHEILTETNTAIFIAKYCETPGNVTALFPNDSVAVCYGDTAILTGQGANYYTWFDSIVSGSIIGEGDSLLLPAYSSQWVYVEGSVGDCISARSGIYMDVITLDTTVIIQDSTLIAIDSLATYQWLDCNSGFAPIDDAISQAFTPAEDGSYAVEISRDICKDTSSCYYINIVGDGPVNQKQLFQVYPNPTNKEVNIVFGKKVENIRILIHNIHGQVVHQVDANGVDKLSTILSQPPGIYYLSFYANENYQATIKVVRK